MDTYTPSAAVRAPAGPPSARGGRASPPELRSSAASRDGRSGGGTSCSASAASFRSTCAPSRVLAHHDTQPYFSHDDAPPDFAAAGAADAVAAVVAEASPSTSTLSTSAPLDVWQAHRAQAMAYFTAAARELPGESLFRRSPDLDSDNDRDDNDDGGDSGAECHAARKAAAWLLFDCGAKALSPLSPPPPPAASARPVHDFSSVGAYSDHHLSGRDAPALAAAPFPGGALAVETAAVGAEGGTAATATTAAVWRADTTSSAPPLRQSPARADADGEGEPEGDEEGCARSGSDGDAPLSRYAIAASSAALVFCPTPATRTHAGAWRHRMPASPPHASFPTPHALTSSVRPAPTPTLAAGGDSGAASSVDASPWRDTLLRGRAGAMPTFSPRDPARGGGGSGGDAEADAATESDEDSSVWEDWADDVFDEGGAMRLAELVLCVLRLLPTLVLRFACCGCVCVTVPLRWLRRRRPCVCGGAVCILCLDCLPLADSDEEEDADDSAAEDDHLLPDTRGADHRAHDGAWAAPHRLWHAYHAEERGGRLPVERRPLLPSRAATARPLHLAGPDSDGEDEEDISDVAREGEGWAGSASSGSRPSRTRHTIPARATPTPSSPLPQLPPSSRGTASATAKRDGESGRHADLTSRPVPAASALPSTRRLRFTWVPTSVRHAAVSCRRATHRTIDFYRVWKRPRHDAAASPTDPGGIDHYRRTASADLGAAGLAERAGATAGTPRPLPRRPPPRRGTLMRVPSIGRVYVTLQYVTLAMLTATVAMLGVFAYRRTRVAEVHDATACNTFSFEDRVQADLTFSLVCFMLNGLLTVRFAVRAVRYEKGGLLVEQAVVVALQVCRAAYFLPFVATSYMRAAPAPVPPPTAAATTLAGLSWPSWGRHQNRLELGRGVEALCSGGGRGVGDGEWARRGVFSSSPSSSSSSAFSDSGSAPTHDPGRPLEPVLEPLFALTCVGVASSVVLFVVSALLTPWVHASFGWRQYAQGIVQISLSRVRQRLTVLRTCVQLDSVTTANAYLATVFLLDNWSDQGVLLLATGSVLALHYVLIAALRRAQHWWPLLCAAAVLVTVSGYYAAVIGSTLQADHQLRSRSSAPWFSTCYTEQLPRCLDGISPVYPVSIYRDFQEGDMVGGWSPGDGRSLRTHLASLSHAVVQAAALTRSSHASLVLHAVPAPPAVQRVRNTTHTFLPTEGTFADYFQISWCNAACFADEEAGSHHALQRGIASCCAQYGQCRLKDAYRTYAVLLLLLLVITSFVVRVVLLAVAWGRWVEEDDKSIELFLRERHRWRAAPPRAGHRQRQQQQRWSRARSTRLAAPASMPPQQPHCRSNSGSPSALVGSPPFSPVSSAPVQHLGRAGLPVPQTPPPPPAGDALVASSGPASPPPPPPPLVWSSEQYALWRGRQGAQARVR